MSDRTIKLNSLNREALGAVFDALQAEAAKQDDATNSGESTPKALRSLANDVFDLREGKHSGLEIRRAE